MKGLNEGRTTTTHGFLELVPEKYNDDELVEWEPAAPPISRPDEPGDLGIFYNFYIYLTQHFCSSLTIFSYRFLIDEFLLLNLC